MSQDKYNTFLGSDDEEENNLSQNFILKKLAKATSCSAHSIPNIGQKAKCSAQDKNKSRSYETSTFLNDSIDEEEDLSTESGIRSFVDEDNSLSTVSSNNSNESDLKELKSLVLKLVKQNEEILERVQCLEDEKKGTKKSAIMVPNYVRHKVRQAYEERIKQGEEVWNVDDNKGAFHTENLATTDYIRNFVSGLYPNLENRDAIINSAVKTYYTSKLTTARHAKKNPNQTKKAAKSQRKIHKAERRKSAFKTHVQLEDQVMKENLLSVIVPEMMSSEDEAEDENGSRYFRIKKPAFRTKKYEKLIKIADDAYDKHMSKRSRDQMVAREMGSPSKRPKPNSLKFGYDKFFKAE